MRRSGLDSRVGVNQLGLSVKGGGGGGGGKGFGGGYVGKCNEPFGGIGMMVMDITHYNVLLLMHQLSIM